MSRFHVSPGPAKVEVWPSLPLHQWRDSCSTLHMWMQIVGKTRLAFSPMLNHWWQATFYVTARGLTTSPIPYGERLFELEFDFIDHALHLRTSDGATRSLALTARPVADFYREYLATLHGLGIVVRVWPMPVEVERAIRFDQDREHASYDTDYAHRFWRNIVQTHRVLEQ
jgi:hypothetical protein